jgi:hypothetical protein
MLLALREFASWKPLLSNTRNLKTSRVKFLDYLTVTLLNIFARSLHGANFIDVAKRQMCHAEKICRSIN